MPFNLRLWQKGTFPLHKPSLPHTTSSFPMSVKGESHLNLYRSPSMLPLPWKLPLGNEIFNGLQVVDTVVDTDMKKKALQLIENYTIRSGSI